LSTRNIFLVKSQNKHIAVPFKTCAFKHPGILIQVFVIMDPTRHEQESLFADRMKEGLQS